MKIIVGFSRAKSCFALGSKVIQLVEKRPYSHVFVRYIHPITNIALVTQASHGMVNMMNFDLFQEHNVVVKDYHFDVPPEKYKKFLEFLHKNIGKPYSKWQLVLIGIKKIFGVELHMYNKDKEFICSEWGARILEVLDIVNTCDEDYLTPSNLDSLINKQIQMAHLYILTKEQIKSGKRPKTPRQKQLMWRTACVVLSLMVLAEHLVALYIWTR